jgi:hypothetical protein
MAWILATTLDDRSANLNTSQIAAILDRVPGRAQDGSVIILAGSGGSLECKESAAELLRSIENEERPGDTSAQPMNVW